MTDEAQAISGPDFSSMTIQQLRQYASHAGVAVPKTANTEDMRKLLNAKLQGKSMPELSTDESVVRPGYSKIIVQEDSTPGAANLPVFVQINGYQATLPRGKEIIVPNRIVRVLQDAKVKRRKQAWVPGPDGREQLRETTVTVPSYPFSVIEMVPGPDALTALEIAKARVLAPRKRYQQMFGHWPKRGELKRAIEQGFIKLDAENESLAASEEKLVTIGE